MSIKDLLNEFLEKMDWHTNIPKEECKELANKICETPETDHDKCPLCGTKMERAATFYHNDGLEFHPFLYSVDKRGCLPDKIPGRFLYCPECGIVKVDKTNKEP